MKDSFKIPMDKKESSVCWGDKSTVDEIGTKE